MTTFTIVIPVYNGQSHIRETVQSVIKHSHHQDREIIVINDGSTDKTLEILDMFKSEIKIVNQPNAGEANAVNKGISLAKGRYILVVSADDPLISEELFDHARNIMDSDEKIVAVYPDWQMIDLENTDEFNAQNKTNNPFASKDEIKKVDLECLPSVEIVGVSKKIHLSLEGNGMAETLDFKKLPVAKLRELASAKNVSAEINKLKKSELIELLEQNH